MFCIGLRNVGRLERFHSEGLECGKCHFSRDWIGGFVLSAVFRRNPARILVASQIASVPCEQHSFYYISLPGNFVTKLATNWIKRKRRRLESGTTW